DEQHRDHRAAPVELLLQFKAAHARHADVEHQAAGLRRVECREEFLRRGDRRRRYAHRLQQQPDRGAHARVVVDHEYGGCPLLHDVASAAGRASTKRAPRGGQGSWRSEPPCACAMVWLIGRPRPVPWRLVLRKGSNRRAATSGSTPAPLSHTANSQSPVGVARACTMTSRSPGGLPATDSSALRTRLSSACAICTRWITTRGSPGWTSKRRRVSLARASATHSSRSSSSNSSG